MKYNINFFIAITCAVVLFSSCAKIAVEEDDEIPSLVSEQESAKLNIITRSATSDSEESLFADGCVYILNAAGKCVQMLSFNEESNQATAQLAAGTYNLYAVAGDDLSRFSLPTQSEATSSSVITLLNGKVMDDLLMASAEVELEDGETVNQNLVLKHKVICVDDIEIREVPQFVTKVEISLSPLYSSVQLDGDYLSTPTESYKVALTKQDDGKTWKVTPHQMLFPSKGLPTIKVSITTDEGVVAYSYTAAEELPANHHITIIGTYKVSQGVTLTGVLTDGGWDEDRIITFDFDESNEMNPVAGQFFRDYYVVTVDASSRKAVLLAKAVVDYVAPNSEDSQDPWLQAFVAPMAALDKPLGVSAGNWRLPTTTEVKIFTADPNVINFTTSKGSLVSATYYCLEGNSLNWGESSTTDYINYIFRTGSGFYASGIYLRPVIDITY